MVAATIFTGFGVSHLIDDFLFGVPAEFNLSDAAAQFLGLIFFVALTGLIALAARGRRRSYLRLGLIGFRLALADTLAHLPNVLADGEFRNGLPSVVFSVGPKTSIFFLATAYPYSG